MRMRKEKEKKKSELSKEEKILGQFRKELEGLMNKYCIDTLCNKPDYELAELVIELLALIIPKNVCKESRICLDSKKE